MSQGVQVLDAGVCTLPQLRFALASLRADAAALIGEDRMIPVGANGARLPSRVCRAVQTMNARHDYAGPFSGITAAGAVRRAHGHRVRRRRGGLLCRRPAARAERRRATRRRRTCFRWPSAPSPAPA